MFLKYHMRAYLIKFHVNPHSEGHNDTAVKNPSSEFMAIRAVILPHA